MSRESKSPIPTADLVCLPNAIADELVRRGEATLIDSDARSFNADGSFLKTRRLILRKLSVGEHQLTNIMAADGCSDALFGQSALQRFPSYEIDNAHSTLVLNDASPSPPPQTEAPVIVATPAAPGAPVLVSSLKVRYSGAFNQGRADRQAYNTWFAGLPKGSQEQQGALDWASTRGTPRAADGCYIAAVGGVHAERWLNGCVKAKVMLDSFDHKRLTNADYRAGWNSL